MTKQSGEDPRITRTRRLILEAFTASLAESSFASLTVQELAAAAGINRSTFYAHFSDKYALLDFTIEQLFNQELEKQHFNSCDYSEANLRQLIAAVCEFVAKSHRQCPQSDPQFESLVETRVKKQLQHLLLDWLGEKTMVISPSYTATGAGWAIYGLATYWYRSTGREKPAIEQYAGEVLPLVSAMFARASGS